MAESTSIIDQKIQDRIQQLAAEIVASDNVSQAVDLAKYVNQLLTLEHVADQAPAVAATYQGLVIPLRWVALSAVPWNEVTALFKNHLVAGLRAGADGNFKLVDKLKNRLRSELFLEERDHYRSQIREALQANGETLTSLPIEHVDTKSIPPTVKNWVAEYVETFGAKPADELAYRDWLTKHLTFNKLPAEERAMVEAVFDLYEELKYSSLTPEGNEDVLFTSDEAGNLYQYTEGGLEKIDPDGKVQRLIEEELKRSSEPKVTSLSAPPAGPAVIAPAVVTPPAVKPVMAPTPPVSPTMTMSREEIMRRYQGDPAQAEALAARQQQIIDAAQRDTAKIAHQLAMLLTGQSRETTEVVPVVMALAELGVLPSLLGVEATFGQVVEATLKRHQRENDIRQFRLSPAAPKSLRLFLEGIFEDQLQLSEDEAARFGLRVANLLARAGKEQYRQLAYFDMGKNQFRWQA